MSDHHEEDEDDAHHQSLLPETFVDIGSAGRKPPLWIIKDLLPAGLMFVGGPPKTAMKSTVVLSMALAVSEQGRVGLPKHLLQVAEPGRVVGFSYEADAGELREIAEAGMGVTVHSDGSLLIADDPFDFRLDDEDGLKRLLHWLEVLKPRLVFLDPLRDFHSVEEKDSGAMNRLLRPLQKWAKENNSCFLVVHHTAKKKKEEGDYDAGDLRGTGALFGMADGALMISPRVEGTIHIAATFKRGAGWQKTLVMGAWGRVAEEVLGDIERSVLKLATQVSPADIAKQLHISPRRVEEAIRLLTTAGKLKPAKKKAAKK